MLLITRRTGESIIINGSIQVKIVDVKGGRVKLGFEYPEGNTIYREELFQKIQDENRSAARGAGVPVADPAKLADSLQKLLRSKQPATARAATSRTPKAGSTRSGKTKPTTD